MSGGLSVNNTPQGLTPRADYSLAATSTLALKSIRLKLQGQKREVSERRQVGDTEEMLRANEETKGAWWRNVGMEEGM
jgi:hypothetical protein